MLIEEVQTDQFWEAVTVPELEQVRMRLRGLVKFIEKSRREPVYTNFEDTLRGSEIIALPGISTGVDTERFREKTMAFLRDKLEEPAIHKVRWNEPLSSFTHRHSQMNSPQGQTPFSPRKQQCRL
jgi:type I restriction enzyme R subunit